MKNSVIYDLAIKPRKGQKKGKAIRINLKEWAFIPGFLPLYLLLAK
jgi:hypothetical protein